MSFTDSIEPDLIGKYEQITDWDDFLQKNHPNSSFLGMEYAYKIFICDVSFIGGEYKNSIRFSNCYFKKDFYIYSCSFLNFFSCTDCSFDNHILIGGETKFTDSFSCYLLKIRGKFSLLNGDFQSTHLDINSCNSIYLHKGTFEKFDLLLNDTTVSLLHLGQLSGSISINGSSGIINDILIEGVLKEKTNLLLQDITVNRLNINNFRNEGVFRLSNLKPRKRTTDSEFSISNSYLGKAELYSIDFSKFASFNITNVHLVESAYVNIKLPKQIDAFIGTLDSANNQTELKQKILRLENREYYNINEKGTIENDKNVLEYYSKKKETIRQLKLAFGKQGDVVNEQKLHALEMVSFDKSLTWQNDFFTKMIIKFSYYFSDFGQSFDRPFISLLAFGFVSFMVLLLNEVYCDLHFSITNPTFEGFKIGLNYYIQLLNPLRAFDGKMFKGLLIIVDVAMRIWSSYMIYNIVRATRRFIK